MQILNSNLRGIFAGALVGAILLGAAMQSIKPPALLFDGPMPGSLRTDFDIEMSRIQLEMDAEELIGERRIAGRELAMTTDIARYVTASVAAKRKKGRSVAVPLVGDTVFMSATAEQRNDMEFVRGYLEGLQQQLSPGKETRVMKGSCVDTCEAFLAWD